MEYKIIEHENVAGLERLVNAAIANGFEPIGGVSVLLCEWKNERKGYVEYEWNYAQAMLKRE